MRYAYDIFSIPILCFVVHVDGTTEARLRIISLKYHFWNHIVSLFEYPDTELVSENR